jgi:hypothetical protein
VDPPTLPERFPEVPAAPGVAADALVKMKSDPLPRSMQPTIVIGVLSAPVVVCVPGRDVVSVRAPAVDDPGCCALGDPGFSLPLCTGDWVGA